jgi:exodeoxyribonuclease VII small subunit
MAAKRASGHSAAGTAEPFGVAMERLEGIVARLEGDETLGLEEAIALYQEGAALAGECRRRLSAAQLTMTELPVKAPDADDPAADPAAPATDDPDDGSP